MQQQGVGSQQQDLEKHEQVEQITGQEGAVNAHQLELEQGMKVGTLPVAAPAGIEHAEQGQ